MAEKKIVAASLNLDLDAAIKDTLKLKDEIKGLNETIKKAQAGSDEQVAAYKRLGAAQKELSSVQSKLNSTTDSGNKSFANLKTGLTEMNPAFSKAAAGSNLFNGALNVLKANPIIAVISILVLIIVSLFERFKKMEAVSDSLGKAFGALSGVFNFFMNKILTPLIDGFTFLIDLVGKAANFLLSKISPSMAEVAKRSGELAEELDNLNEQEEKSALARAESNLRLKEAREIAADANIPIKDRIKALKEAAAIEKEEAEKSIKLTTDRVKNLLEQLGNELGIRKELIQTIRNGSIAQLEAARNEIETMKGVNTQKLKAITDLIIQAKNTAAEAATSGRKSIKETAALEREGQQKREEAAKAAAERAKAAAEKLAAFNEQLLKIRQENELLLIKDGYQKELKALEFKIAEEKRANEKSLKDGKINRDQFNLLKVELDKKANALTQQLQDKHNEELKVKEDAFQKELAGITLKTKIAGIKDAREVERVQLNIGYEEKLQDAILRYKDDEVKLNQIRAALQEQQRLEQQKLDEKFKLEDDKKKLDEEVARQQAIIDSQNFDFAAKLAAVDAEQALFQKTFDDKLITEQEYNSKIKEFTEARKKIADVEMSHRIQIFQITGAALNSFSDLVGKNTALGKTMAVAETVINTYAAAWAIFKNASKNPTTIPFPAYPYIQAGIAIVAGLQTVKTILSVKTPGGSGGGSVPSSPGITAPAAPLAPTQSSTAIDQNSIAGIGDATSRRTYVLSSDIERDASRNARLNRQARLGG